MNNDLITYKCNDCKSEFSSYKSKKVDTCIYCASKSINLVKNKDYENAFVIPFTIEEELVKKSYKKKTFWNPLIPFRFKGKKAKEKIEKVYYPCYLIDANVRGTTSFTAADKNKVLVGGRRLTELKKYNVKHDVNLDYSDILINAFDKITDKEFSKIFHYNFDNLKEYNENNLKNIVILNPNLEEKQVKEIALERLTNKSLSLVRNSVHHQLKKIDNNSINLKFESIKLVLVPIYFLSLTYRKKVYKYIVNGTSNNVYYKFPIGILETILFSIILFGIVFGISYYISSIL